MNRRRFLTHAIAAAAVAPLAPVSLQAAASGLIDTNTWLSHWPTRRSWAETPVPLVAKLRAHGVTAAWTGNFDAALHSDIAGANARLATACARDGGGILMPFGTVNPALPDWEDDLRRCQETHRMPGVRILPSYHGYGLDDPRFARLLDLAAQRGLLVQIVASMEDDRSQNPGFTAPFLSVAPLPDLLEKTPRARVMILNGTSRILGANTPLLQRLIKAGTCFEIATLESVAGIETLLQRSPEVRVAFGSHAPYFYFEAALLKLQESNLTAAQLTAVRHGHATAALARS
ncbi:amidohydrolase family protein [Horticoccus sp. 23ND18S-11]|uniref:amidohydrolase family protein n=1 Tax=Horticoccus sp. 23ND18S-11 TaxID=3391832 RepID=UPI0039C9631E